MFSKVEGKLWVDKQDLGWIRADGEVIQPFSMGLFLARVLRGSHIMMMEQTRIDEGTWVPEHVEVWAAAKIFFVKSLVINRALTYSEYRLPQAEAPTGDPVIRPCPLALSPGGLCHVFSSPSRERAPAIRGGGAHVRARSAA